MKNIVYLTKILNNFNCQVKSDRMINESNIFTSELFRVLTDGKFEFLAAKILPDSIVLFAEKRSAVSIQRNRIKEKVIAPWIEINDYEVVSCSKELNYMKKTDFSRVIEKNLTIRDVANYEYDRSSYKHSQIKHNATYEQFY